MLNSLAASFYPIHPKLVHFPIALVVCAFGMQALGMALKKEHWCRGAWLMFVLAAIFIPWVILSGLFEANRLNLHHPVLNAHKTFAFWTQGVFLAGLPLLWFVRLRNAKAFQRLFLAVLMLVSSLITLTAYEGGRMVYDYGVGVSQ